MCNCGSVRKRALPKINTGSVPASNAAANIPVMDAIAQQKLQYERLSTPNPNSDAVRSANFRQHLTPKIYR